MKHSEMFRDNAENCAQLAESAPNDPAHQRYKRMEAAWRALADEQDWLDGEISPMRNGNVSAFAQPARRDPQPGSQPDVDETQRNNRTGRTAG
jgi:hypothetical protein